MNKKYLVFGSTGYVGSEFIKQLEHQGEAAPSYKEFKTFRIILDYLHYIKPNVVVNAAGYTGKPNVDACETQKDQCYFGNVLFPVWLAQACDLLSIPFAHVSSGCIYNGYDKVYTENDESDFSFKQNNCSFYSGTKAEAELLLREFPQAYIWRLRIPFNKEHSPRNYLTKMLNYNKILNLDNSISHKEEFVSTCLKTITNNIPYGIYNVTNEGYINAKRVFELFALHRPEFKELINSKTFYTDVEEFMKDAVAPRSNCVLNTDKLFSHGLRMRHAEDVVTECIIKYGK